MARFESEDLAGIFLYLGLSDEGLSNALMATPLAQRDSLVTQPRTEGDFKVENRSTFLTLPVEIRLQIYNILLVSRFDRSHNPSWAVGSTNQKKMSLDSIQAPQYQTMEPSILGTCKKVYSEAVSIIYSVNSFLISDPESFFKLHAQTPPEIFLLIKSPYLYVPSKAGLSQWLDFLPLMAEKAHGLRRIRITWDAFTNFLWLGFRKGLGNNSRFVRALANIPGLDELVIKGFYRVNWPSFLEAEMGIPVKVHCGRDLISTSDAGNHGEELENFRNYQFGTQNLMPYHSESFARGGNMVTEAGR